jgi:hypothetical protein
LTEEHPSEKKWQNILTQSRKAAKIAKAEKFFLPLRLCVLSERSERA